MTKRQSPTEFARHRRRNQTTHEYLLWQFIRHRQLDGFKFRRQHPLAPYTVDFYCDQAKLAIELDGSGHRTEEGEAYDQTRDHYLSKLGVKVLRFESKMVDENLVDVLSSIKHELRQRMHELAETPHVEMRNERS